MSDSYEYLNRIFRDLISDNFDDPLPKNRIYVNLVVSIHKFFLAYANKQKVFIARVVMSLSLFFSVVRVLTLPIPSVIVTLSKGVH